MKKDYFKGFNNRKIEVVDMCDFDTPDLFVHFPGFAYGMDHPFFFYLGKILSDLKVNQIFIDYRWSDQPEMFKDVDLMIKNLKYEIQKGYEFIANKEYEKLHVVGKSMGTTALEMAGNEISIESYKIKNLFWVTPFRNTQRLPEIELYSENYFYVGDHDQFYIEDVYEKLKDMTNVRLFENLDHSFMVPGNTEGSLDGLKSALLSIEEDIKKALS